MEALVRTNIGCNLNVRREYQQQESMHFMSLFHRKMVIRQVSIFAKKKPPTTHLI
jgi:hypothetical protein